jgi:hypothetical protein
MVNETARINFEATNLDVVEGRIKAIGGAINVLGGSIEVVVGTMGLIGIDEKVTKQFQEAATSAIAFADGAKRVFEGYKELREASQLFRRAQEASTAATVASTTATTAHNAAQASAVGILGKARAAFNALTAAMVRNPITAVVVGLTALVAALVVFSDENEDAAESTDKLAEAERQLTRDLALRKVVNESLILDAKLRGASEREVLKITLAQVEADQLLLVNAQNKRKAEIGFYESLKEAGKAKKADLDYLKKQKELYEEYKDDVIAGENAIKTIKLQVMGLDKAAAEKQATAAKTPMEKFKAELSALNDKYDQEEGLLLKRKLLGEKVDDAILKSQQDRFSASIKLMEKYNITDKNIVQQELARRQQLADDTKRIEKEAEENRNADRDKTFNNAIKYLDNFYKAEKTRILQQKLTKEESDELLKQNENLRLQAQLKLYKQYGKDVTDIQAQIAANNQQFTEESVSDLTDFFNSELAKQISGVLSAVNSITSGMLQMAESDSEARLNSIEAEYNARMEGLVGTDEEIAAQQEAIEAEKNRVMEAERRRAFEDQKKLKIADTITSGMAAAFQAFGSAMELGPVLGPIVGAALSAMILAQMANTVQNLQRQQYIGSSSGGAGGGGMGASGVGGYTMSNAGGGFSGAGAPMTGGSSGGAFGGGNMSAPNPQNNTLPVRAYVVASDVSNGLDAQADIDSRRTL